MVIYVPLDSLLRRFRLAQEAYLYDRLSAISAPIHKLPGRNYLANQGLKTEFALIQKLYDVVYSAYSSQSNAKVIVIDDRHQKNG